MSESTFKVGDRVKLVAQKISDLESDMQQDLADRSLEGKDYDTISDAMYGSLGFVVASVVSENGYDTYSLKTAGGIEVSYEFDEDDLISMGIPPIELTDQDLELDPADTERRITALEETVSTLEGEVKDLRRCCEDMSRQIQEILDTP